MNTTHLDSAAAASIVHDHPGALSITPFEHGFGAEIGGIDLREPLAQASFDQIHKAFIDHHVLVFRAQPIDDLQHLQFAQRFGPLDGHINRSTRHNELPKVQIFSNVGTDGKATGRYPDKGTLVWHTDKSYLAEPSLTTVLRSPAIAKRGGATSFADMQRAYESLPEATRDRVDKLQAVHDWQRSRQRTYERPATAQEIADAPPVTHPLVRTHPVTGRKGLYIGNHVAYIVGMPLEESEALLKALLAHATQPQFVYRHQWQVDDVLMWDNRCTLHCVEPYDANTEARAVHRVVVRGDRPF